MGKSLIIYLLCLIAVDAIANVIIGLILHSPGSVILISGIVRAICIFILFAVIGTIVFSILNGRIALAGLVITTILVYILIPAIIYLLKDNNKTIVEVYVDLHSRIDLFTQFFLPYILASIICIMLVRKLKIF